MQHRKDLAQIALAAVILASANPMSGHAETSQEVEVQGTFLAAGCAAHGCPSPKKNNATADNTSDGKSSYNIRNNSYQTGNDSSSGTQGDYNSTTQGNSSPSEEGSYDRNARSTSETYLPSSYNTQQSGTTTSGYVEDYRNTTPNSSEYKGMNRESTHTPAADNDKRAAVTTSTLATTLTEAQLLGLLSPQGRAIYLSLDPEGKALTIQLSSQDSYRDKNLAVKEAQRRMSERRSQVSR